MNVGELKAVLADLPDGVEVILSKDGEGNRYRPDPCELLPDGAVPGVVLWPNY